MRGGWGGRGGGAAPAVHFPVHYSAGIWRHERLQVSQAVAEGREKLGG